VSYIISQKVKIFVSLGVVAGCCSLASMSGLIAKKDLTQVTFIGYCMITLKTQSWALSFIGLDKMGEVIGHTILGLHGQNLLLSWTQFSNGV
jgi:hypothetical protein